MPASTASAPSEHWAPSFSPFFACSEASRLCLPNNISRHADVLRAESTDIPCLDSNGEVGNQSRDRTGKKQREDGADSFAAGPRAHSVSPSVPSRFQALFLSMMVGVNRSPIPFEIVLSTEPPLRLLALDDQRKQNSRSPMTESYCRVRLQPNVGSGDKGGVTARCERIETRAKHREDDHPTSNRRITGLLSTRCLGGSCLRVVRGATPGPSIEPLGPAIPAMAGMSLLLRVADVSQNSRRVRFRR